VPVLIPRRGRRAAGGRARQPCLGATVPKLRARIERYCPCDRSRPGGEQRTTSPPAAGVFSAGRATEVTTFTRESVCVKAGARSTTRSNCGERCRSRPVARVVGKCAQLLSGESIAEVWLRIRRWFDDDGAGVKWAEVSGTLDQVAGEAGCGAGALRSDAPPRSPTRAI